MGIFHFNSGRIRGKETEKLPEITKKDAGVERKKNPQLKGKEMKNGQQDEKIQKLNIYFKILLNK
ncbi:hypothetical protein FGU46_08360 [Methanobacterium sp. CWC-01]|uniref:hypothetical protein n=1 Tax=Methanobacterium aridiramus TaxID=2584467 RepID=UPI0025780A51|nr:hypothetical protein [Methanobacterium sp. CWC-01]WJI10102.1 hypothetical protein FGU46_08360 [Methanobacterium sp. CWC-01]